MSENRSSLFRRLFPRAETKLVIVRLRELAETLSKDRMFVSPDQGYLNVSLKQAISFARETTDAYRTVKELDLKPSEYAKILLYREISEQIACGGLHEYRNMLGNEGKELLSICHQLIDDVVEDGNLEASEAADLRVQLKEDIKRAG